MKKICKFIMSSVSAACLLSVSVTNAFAEDSSSTTTSTSSTMPMLVSMVLLLLVMYFLMIRPQKKKEKEAKDMQANIEIGDEIVTIGGIVGLVVRKGDDNVVIETGGEKNKMRIKLWAISENTSAIERSKAAAAAKKSESANIGLAAAQLKEEKKSKKNKKSSDGE